MQISKITCTPVCTIRKVDSNKGRIQTNPINYDRVSFSGAKSINKLLTEIEGLEASEQLKKSTSGYRAKLGEKFNDSFVTTMTGAYIQYLKDNGIQKTLIGGDTREATKKYLPVIRDILTDKGIDVFIPKLDTIKAGEHTPTPSPVLALSVRDYKIPLGILMTASHNPWEDGGYNFLTDEGAVADDRVTLPIANNLAKVAREGRMPKSSTKKGNIIYFDPYERYMQHIKKQNLIDFDRIKDANIEIYYDGLQGCGSHYFPRMMQENGITLAKVMNSKVPGPEPNKQNLTNLAQEVKKSNKKMCIGLATDGDSDRFGVIDENGNFIGADDVLALVSYHMIKNLGMTHGTIVRNTSTSVQLDNVAKYFNELDPKKYDINLRETPVGFKYLGGLMLKLEGTDKEVILAGEQSGGLALRNHIPEKDGFVAISKILELMAYENLPIGQILKEVKEKAGGDYHTLSLKYKFADDSAKEQAQNYFLDLLNEDTTSFAGEEVNVKKTLTDDKAVKVFKPSGDGAKFILKNGTSVQVRKSGTEPVLRVTIDSDKPKLVQSIVNNLSEILDNLGGKQV